jgi:hypothetical protein
MRIKKANTFEARLYIGSVQGYHGTPFTFEELKEEVGNLQSESPKEEMIPVRIAPTNFVCGNYSEAGWEIAAINYPRFPKAEALITSFMMELAKRLLVCFNQNRISIIFPNETIMFESEEAEQVH